MRASLRRWHRRTGLAAGVLLLLLAVSGVLINHADALGLAQRQLRAEWLLRWYGLQAPGLRGAQPLQAQWLSQWGQALYLDADRLRLPAVQQLVGAVALPGLWLVADRRQALLLDRQGALVDALPYPDGFVARRVGLVAQPPRAVIEADGGERLWADGQATGLREAGTEAPSMQNVQHIEWAQAAPLPAALHSRIAASTDTVGVSTERLLLDLHSGRWLGRGGVWLMDAAALALLLLAGTGAWTVWRRWRNKT